MRKYHRNQKSQNQRNTSFKENSREQAPYEEHQRQTSTATSRSPRGSQGLMEELVSRDQQISRWLSPHSSQSALATPEPRSRHPFSNSDSMSGAFQQPYPANGNGWHPPYACFQNPSYYGSGYGHDSGYSSNATRYGRNGPAPSYPQLVRANERWNRDKLFMEEYRYAGLQQEYQPPTCGQDTMEPVYKPISEHYEAAINPIIFPPWRFDHYSTPDVHATFKFDPEAPEFVPVGDKAPAKKETAWLIVGN